ncbi:MAG: DUF1254 domain-containing protein [Xanthobacteraceae bacterium]|nr:DUF1254 domain-containing protein [Xanthobacteraceae bacterium]
MPVIRIALPVAAGLVLGGLVHILSIFALPQLAQNDAYARLSALGKTNEIVQVPDPTPFESLLPRLDPAFVFAACVFDLSRGPLALSVPTTPDLVSVAFYTRQGRVFYSLNDRAAARRSIDLQLMTAEQRALLPRDEDVTAADRLIIESPATLGIIFVRAFVREEGARANIRELLSKAKCGPLGAVR